MWWTATASLRLRLIYHQCEPRIEAHIFVAFLVQGARA
jgi:hypothetical protein